jgi:hypothetical protein
VKFFLVLQARPLAYVPLALAFTPWDWFQIGLGFNGRARCIIIYFSRA